MNVFRVAAISLWGVCLLLGLVAAVYASLTAWHNIGVNPAFTEFHATVMVGEALVGAFAVATATTAIHWLSTARNPNARTA